MTDIIKRTSSNNANRHHSFLPSPNTATMTNVYDCNQVTIATVNGGTGKPMKTTDLSNPTSTVS